MPQPRVAVARTVYRERRKLMAGVQLEVHATPPIREDAVQQHQVGHTHTHT